MKKLSALSLVAAATFAGHAAHAQSVQIYGAIDTGVETLSNVGVSGGRLTRVPGLTC